VETITKTYVNTILFRVDPNDRRKLSSKIFNIAKGSKAVKEIKVSELALGKIQSDALVLKPFLIQTLGQDEEEGVVKDLMTLLTDMIDFMAAPADQLLSFTVTKMETLPQCALNIKDFLDGTDITYQLIFLLSTYIHAYINTYVCMYCLLLISYHSIMIYPLVFTFTRQLSCLFEMIVTKTLWKR
tara:strand:+ start:1469 stop:2023 length:555 start_codon:yes stop_codon:yes gene_type:complete